MYDVSIINNPYEGLKPETKKYHPVAGEFQLSIIPMRDWNNLQPVLNKLNTVFQLSIIPMRDWNATKESRFPLTWIVSIINNPYEGLKRSEIGCEVEKIISVSIINNPYEGLKLRNWCIYAGFRLLVSIINNPYEGLKPATAIIPITAVQLQCFNYQ